MDKVLFAFVDSVAHFISKNSAALLASVFNKIWENVGLQHLKRVDCNLTINICDNGESFAVLEKGFHPIWLNPVEIFEHIVECDRRYMKIDLLTLDYTRDDVHESPGMWPEVEFSDKNLESLRLILSAVPVRTLHVYNNNHPSHPEFLEKIACAWKMPVEQVSERGSGASINEEQTNERGEDNRL